jgi:hypothetical protein
VVPDKSHPEDVEVLHQLSFFLSRSPSKQPPYPLTLPPVYLQDSLDSDDPFERLQTLIQIQQRNADNDMPPPPLPPAAASSSDEEQESVANRVKHVIVNGSKKKARGEADKAVESKSESEPDEPCDPGMKSGLKNLYSGKEDKKGRYQWQDKVPEDIGDPAENDKTAKWALLVRNIKVYNDPRKVRRTLCHSW